MTGEHSSKQYDHELEAIRSKVLLMGGLVETQFDEALECFRIGDIARAERVMAEDQAVNQLEVALDDACSHLIVQRQPTANDLRTVMATIKVITDLERIGDEATKIARTAKSLHERGATGFAPFRHDPHDRQGDVRHCCTMRSTRSRAWTASRPCRSSRSDEVVDHEFRVILRNLITFMMEDPRTISSALDTLWVAKAIERIGDHAKNIAEYVIYVVEGTRHPPQQADARRAAGTLSMADTTSVLMVEDEPAIVELVTLFAARSRLGNPHGRYGGRRLGQHQPGQARTCCCWTGCCPTRPACACCRACAPTATSRSCR